MIQGQALGKMDPVILVERGDGRQASGRPLCQEASWFGRYLNTSKRQGRVVLVIVKSPKK